MAFCPAVTASPSSESGLSQPGPEHLLLRQARVRAQLTALGPREHALSDGISVAPTPDAASSCSSVQRGSTHAFIPGYRLCRNHLVLRRLRATRHATKTGHQHDYEHGHDRYRRDRAAVDGNDDGRFRPERL